MSLVTYKFLINKLHIYKQNRIFVVYYAYTYTNICGNIVNNNDDFNERTNEHTSL